MPEIKQVAAMTEAPAGDDPGRVSYGRYAVDCGKVVICGEDDEPMTDKRGNRYERELVDGIATEQIAAQLTIRIRRELGGQNYGYNRPLNLPRETLV